MSLGEVFDRRNNALNAWRLILATGVILAHSWPLTGRSLPHREITQVLSQVSVDGFFTISGFLITASWCSHPRLREYLAARALRIFPGLWVCVLVVALIIAPLSEWISGDSPWDVMLSAGAISWAANNAVLNVFVPGIPGTLDTVPWPHVWDSPLYTLIFELACYLVVAGLGVAGLMKRRWTIPIVFVLSLVGAALCSYPIVGPETIPQMIFRFALVFSAGAMIYQFRDRIPARWYLVVACIVLIVAVGATLPNYRVYVAIPLAYAIIASGSLLRGPRLRNDVSYGVYIYAWPMQQLLAVCGLAVLPPAVFFLIATACTVPLAVASWFAIEKRALLLRHRIHVDGARRKRQRRRERTVAPPPEAAQLGESPASTTAGQV